MITLWNQCVKNYQAEDRNNILSDRASFISKTSKNHDFDWTFSVMTYGRHTVSDIIKNALMNSLILNTIKINVFHDFEINDTR